MTIAARSSGMIDVGPGRVWYEEYGQGSSVLLLHGGPGAASDYLSPIAETLADSYRVVRYDQLGCGASDRPADRSLWTVDRYVEEVEQVRKSLALGTVHLIGQSWGSFLALAYALKYPLSVRSLVLYSGAASTRQCFDGMNALRSQLPEDIQQILTRYESTGETNHPTYLEAIDVLLKQHLCRLETWPDLVTEGMKQTAMPVYESMWAQTSSAAPVPCWTGMNRHASAKFACRRSYFAVNTMR